MIICSKEDCCGCGVCKDICHLKAIDMRQDERGFLHPSINEDICVKCNACVNKCPINIADRSCNVSSNVLSSYACYNKDSKVRKNSSSGGVFSIFATEIIKSGGVVFGAQFNSSWSVVHSFADNLDTLSSFRKSKYVQSDINDSYIQAKEFLKQGRKVVFSGTPCQIAALKSFLGKEYDNLYLIDVVCHGVPSDQLWQSYLSFLKKKYKSSIVDIQMRSKDKGWIDSLFLIKFKNHKCYSNSYQNDVYCGAFVQNTILRNGCYHCRFSNLHRLADITLADCWHYNSKNFATWDYQTKGISAVLINSNKGRELFEKIKSSLYVESRNILDIVEGNPNLSHPQQKNKYSELFWNDWIDGLAWNVLKSKYVPDSYVTKKCSKRFWEYKLKPAIKLVLKKTIMR